MDILKLRAELEADEGRRHVPYKDSLGKWTCGIGHFLDREPYPNEYWSDQKINDTFEADVQSIVSAVEKKNWWGRLDTDPRQRALCNMAFNLGVAGVSKFATFLWYVYRQEWDKAVADLRNTKWYAEVPARAERICKLLCPVGVPRPKNATRRSNRTKGSH